MQKLLEITRCQSLRIDAGSNIGLGEQFLWSSKYVWHMPIFYYRTSGLCLQAHHEGRQEIELSNPSERRKSETNISPADTQRTRAAGCAAPIGISDFRSPRSGTPRPPISPLGCRSTRGIRSARCLRTTRPRDPAQSHSSLRQRRGRPTMMYMPSPALIPIHGVENFRLAEPGPA